MKKIISLLILSLVLNFAIAQIIYFDIKVFLEGPFNGTEMNTDLNAAGLIPLNQPFNGAPWNYNGTESVTAIPNTNIVDWILLELRETTGDAATVTPDKMINRQAAFLKADGKVVGTDGSSMIVYNGTINSNLYVIIWHRNHIAIMTSGNLEENGGIYSWDFTDQLNKAYLEGQKALGVGFYGMIGGDCDASNRVFQNDKYTYWRYDAGKSGFYNTDLNFDKQVNNNDINDIWFNNYGINSKIPENWNCGMTFNDTRDGQNYTTVQIGNQCWMAENLNIGNAISGGSNSTNNGVIEKYCYADNNTNCEIYGGLYTWNEMMQYTTQPGAQGICPFGWHVPTDDEWKILEGNVDTQYGIGNTIWNNTGWRGFDAGKRLKSTTGWQGGNGTDAYGFSALPGGYYQGSFYLIGNDCHFWTSTLSSTPFRRYINNSYDNIYRANDITGVGFSLRCISEVPNQPPSIPFNPIPQDNSINIPTTVEIFWTCTDPNFDALLFDVYFGTEIPLQLVSAKQTGFSYSPGLLNNNTTYYWKIIAFDPFSEMTEGSIWSFTTANSEFLCGTPLLDTRDGQYYATSQIGIQCWLAENLNIGNAISGGSNSTNNGVIEKYCYADNNTNCEIYGGLYTWNEMMQYTTQQGAQGICPTGWHVPTDDEWKVLEGTTDTQYGVGNPIWNNTGWRGFDAGKRLKSTTGWQGGNGTDAYGFTALPGGYYQGSFYLQGYDCHFWTSSLQSNYNRRYIKNSSDLIYRAFDGNTGWGFSVRCLRNNQAPSQPTNPTPIDGAQNQPINTTLSWTCSDPENDPLTYDVYFGTSNPPAIVSTGQMNTTFNPGALAYSTIYFWKIVANDVHSNITEGPVWSFTTEQTFPCGTLLVDERDGQSYGTVQIGSQCWMKENLNIGMMIDSLLTQADNGTIEKYCYRNLTINCEIYGGLYQWNEMMNYIMPINGIQGICPEGWHVPSDEEWCIVTQFVDNTVNCDDQWYSGTDVGTKMKNSSGWVYGNGTNTSGFTALPGGEFFLGAFYGIGTEAGFWTSQAINLGAWIRYFNSSQPYMNRIAPALHNGWSVRCLKD
jgi:uncharacterized protein (TIGR02145 family)